MIEAGLKFFALRLVSSSYLCLSNEEDDCVISN